jgi:sugar/nucleoside kinase (ribokinase family)
VSHRFREQKARARKGGQRPPSKIVCVGSVYVDVNIRGLERSRQKVAEREYIGEAYECALGGSAVIFARTAVALGLESILIGKIGQDEFGALANKWVSEAGIRADLIEDPHASTNLGVNETTVDGRTYMTVVHQASQALTPNDVERIGRWARSARYLYLGGLLKTPELVAACARAAREVRSRGTKVLLDHGRMPSSTKRRDVEKMLSLLLPLVDVYFPSIGEASSVWGVRNLGDLFSKIDKRTKAITILKMGEKGAVVRTGGNRLVRVAPREFIRGGRPVGAGDGFNAGVVAAIDHGMDMVEAVRYGNTVAALLLAGRPVSHGVVLETIRNGVG